MSQRQRAVRAVDAETVAIEALGFVASDPELFSRFCAITGLSANEIRDAARAPGFLAGVMAFVTDHEPTLLAFAAHADRTPETVAEARRALEGETGEAWSA